MSRGTWNPNETPKERAERLKRVEAFVNKCNAAPADRGAEPSRILDRAEMIRRRDTAAKLGVLSPESHVLQTLKPDEALQIWCELIPFDGGRSDRHSVSQAGPQQKAGERSVVQDGDHGLTGGGYVPPAPIDMQAAADELERRSAPPPKSRESETDTLRRADDEKPPFIRLGNAYFLCEQLELRLSAALRILNDTRRAHEDRVYLAREALSSPEGRA